MKNEILAELETQQRKLEKQEKTGEIYKNINKAYRAYKKSPDSFDDKQWSAIIGESGVGLVKTWKPAFESEKAPVLPWQMINNNQRIKNTRQRIEMLQGKLQAMDTNESAEYPFEPVTEGELVRSGGKITINAEIDRVQIFFDEKPGEKFMGLLKSYAYNWSPGNGCWQRKITPDTLYRTSRIFGIMLPTI